MYRYELFGIYLRYQKHAKNSKEIFPWLICISKNVYPSVSKFSIRLITSGLDNGRSKTGAVNMTVICPLPLTGVLQVAQPGDSWESANARLHQSQSTSV